MAKTRGNGITRISTGQGIRYRVATRIDGKEYHRRFKTRREAEQWVTAMRRKAHERKVGLAVERVEVKLGEFCQTYLTSVSAERKAASSQERDKQAVELLLEYFDPTRLMSSVEAKELRGLQKWTGRPYEVTFRRQRWSKRARAWIEKKTTVTRQRSCSTVNRLGHTWRHIFTEAEREGHITSNPWRTVENLKVDPPKDRFLTVDELKAVLTEARRYGGKPREGRVDKWGREVRPWKNRPAKYDMESLPDQITWLALMGTRRGEMFRVRWGDVDWERGAVTVDTLKLQSSKRPRRRSIPLHPDVAAMLEARLARHRANSRPGIVVNADGTREMAEELIFPPDKTLLRKFKVCCERAGLEPARIHDLRHTTGTLLAATETPTTVAAVLGHSRTSTTDRYTHTAMETMQQAFARMPRLKVSEGEK